MRKKTPPGDQKHVSGRKEGDSERNFEKKYGSACAPIPGSPCPTATPNGLPKPFLPRKNGRREISTKRRMIRLLTVGAPA